MESIEDTLGMLPNLEKRRVVVIGGSKGMGRAIAATAAKAGATVVVAARGRVALEEVARSIGDAASAATLDILDETAVAEFFRTLGRFDHLVITAHYSSSGVSAVGAIGDIALSGGKKFMDGKFWGPFVAVKHAAHTIAQDGSILLFSGVASQVTLQGHGVIAAVNGAVEAFGRQMARELAPVRVNVLSPGLVDTPTYDPMPEERRRKMFEARAAAQPVGRTGLPGDIAGAALFLMTNGYVTGQTVVVDGGHSVE